MHYYKFNIADWQSSTRHLSIEEEAVYFRLINYYYDTEKPIPLETQPVIRRLVLGSHSDIVQSILDEFFIKTDRGYEKEKCNQIIKEYKKTAKKNKDNGAKGGRPRKDAASKETQTKPTGLPLATQTKPTGNPNQELITKNQEPLTTNHNTKKKPPVDYYATDMVIDYLNEKAGTNYEHKASARDAIKPRLDEYGIKKCFLVIDKKCAEWKGGEQEKYLRPSTLFRKSKFEEYLNQNIIDGPSASPRGAGYKTAQDKRSERNAEIFDYDKATQF